MDDDKGMLKVGSQNSVRFPRDGQPTWPIPSTLPESTPLLSGRVCASTGLALEWNEGPFCLKEHDYMGLVENSASKQSPPADANEDDAVELGGADLHLELGLGLGVASSRKDDFEKYADFLVNEKDGIFKGQKGTSTEPIERVSGALRMSWKNVHAVIADGPNASSWTTLDYGTSKTIPACAQDLREGPLRAGFSTVHGPNSKNGTKRGYTEAMHDAARFDVASGEPVVGILEQGEAKVPPTHQQGASLSSWPPSKPSGPAIWAAASENTLTHAFVSSNGTMTMTNAMRPFKSLELSKDSISNNSPPPNGQVVGWPPIRSYRKQSLTKSTEMYVKVNMDGMTVGRKVDLNAHSSYEGLYLALEEMFHLSIDGGKGIAQSVQGSESRFQEGKQFRFLNGSEYVLTYEDQDGDWMMVGDVPWGMLVSMVRRLRITRKSGATGLTPARRLETIT